MKQSGMAATVRRGSDGTVGGVGGRYESWFVSARDPAGPRALWVRHTRTWPPEPRSDAGGGGAEGRESVGLWCTLFEPEPNAVKQTLSAFPPDALAGPRGFRGAARAGGHAAEWELALAGEEPPLRLLRPALLYRTRLPRTKTEAPLPDGIVTGRLTFDGRRVEIAGWRATVGHNWGAEHAERWVWLHADLEDGWLELVLARIRLGRTLTPWLGGGALSLGLHRLAVGGPGRRARVAAAPGRLDARVGGVRAAVDAPLEHTVAFGYGDPAGGPGREVLHAAAATFRVRVERRGRPPLELAGTGAYELGSRDAGGAVPLQPYLDP
jgi:hypothetical protein